MGLFSALFGGKGKKKTRAERNYLKTARSNQTRWIANSQLRRQGKKAKSKPKTWF